jgi:hypothetical protein
MNQTRFGVHRARQVCVLGSAEPGSSGGWSDGLEQNPPDERGNSRVLSWSSVDELRMNLRELGLLGEGVRS